MADVWVDGDDHAFVNRVVEALGERLPNVREASDVAPVAARFGHDHGRGHAPGDTGGAPRRFVACVSATTQPTRRVVARLELADLVVVHEGAPATIADLAGALAAGPVWREAVFDDAAWASVLQRAWPAPSETATPPVPGWLRLLQEVGIHATEGTNGTIAWRRVLSRTPIHPARLVEMVGTPTWTGAWRARGWLHVAGLPGRSVVVDGVGSDVRARVGGRWWATAHPIRWPVPGSMERRLLDERWTCESGDRRTEVVLLGPSVAALERVAATLGAAEIDSHAARPGTWEDALAAIDWPLGEHDAS